MLAGGSTPKDAPSESILDIAAVSVGEKDIVTTSMFGVVIDEESTNVSLLRRLIELVQDERRAW